MKDLANIYLNTLVPMVVEQTNRGERAYDIYSRLLKERREQLRRDQRGHLVLDGAPRSKRPSTATISCRPRMPEPSASSMRSSPSAIRSTRRFKS
jgi:hypothetical protein